jgi:hypothetical protein
VQLREEILKEHSKKQSQKIADWVLADKQRFGELLQLFLYDEQSVVRRAAWILSLVNDQEPELVSPHLDKIIDRMTGEGVHVAVKRNVVRILQHTAIPEHLHGVVMTICFELLADPKEAIAVQCCSMSVLDNLSKHYPDIRQELLSIIEDRLQHEASAGFVSRAIKVMKRK